MIQSNDPYHNHNDNDNDRNLYQSNDPFNGLTTQGKSQPETIDFPMKYGMFLYFFPSNESIDP